MFLKPNNICVSMQLTVLVFRGRPEYIPAVIEFSLFEKYRHCLASCGNTTVFTVKMEVWIL